MAGDLLSLNNRIENDGYVSFLMCHGMGFRKMFYDLNRVKGIIK